MRSISECEQLTAELTGKIDSVNVAISEKQKEIQSLRERNARLVEANLRKERMPRSLSVQRDEISRLSQQIEELECVENSLQDRLSKSKEALSFAQLFGQVQQFKQSEEAFFVTMNEIRGCLTDLAHNIETFKQKLVQLRSHNHPLHLLMPILRDLNGKVSFHDFILRGEVMEPNSRDNQYIDRTIQTYRTLRQELPVLSADVNALGSILSNQLSYLSTQATELRHFRGREG